MFFCDNPNISSIKTDIALYIDTYDATESVLSVVSDRIAIAKPRKRKNGQAMSTPICIPCTTSGYGTTKSQNNKNAVRITTDKSQKQVPVNMTTARWASSNRSYRNTSTKKSSNTAFTCPTDYMKSSITAKSVPAQQTAQKTYTNSYGISRQAGNSGNGFNCYG